ncbi:hypothetical protein HK101_004979 [Irineochytrium annulatum]|nr:hypothetical protein HK101_004979 [Irineochytrium annulatum]
MVAIVAWPRHRTARTLDLSSRTVPSGGITEPLAWRAATPVVTGRHRRSPTLSLASSGVAKPLAWRRPEARLADLAVASSVLCRQLPPAVSERLSRGEPAAWASSPPSGREMKAIVTSALAAEEMEKRIAQADAELRRRDAALRRREEEVLKREARVGEREVASAEAVGRVKAAEEEARRMEEAVRRRDEDVTRRERRVGEREVGGEMEVGRLRDERDRVEDGIFEMQRRDAELREREERLERRIEEVREESSRLAELQRHLDGERRHLEGDEDSLKMRMEELRRLDEDVRRRMAEASALDERELRLEREMDSLDARRRELEASERTFKERSTAEVRRVEMLKRQAEDDLQAIREKEEKVVRELESVEEERTRLLNEERASQEKHALEARRLDARRRELDADVAALDEREAALHRAEEQERRKALQTAEVSGQAVLERTKELMDRIKQLESVNASLRQQHHESQKEVADLKSKLAEETRLAREAAASHQRELATSERTMKEKLEVEMRKVESLRKQSEIELGSLHEREASLRRVTEEYERRKAALVTEANSERSREMSDRVRELEATNRLLKDQLNGAQNQATEMKVQMTELERSNHSFQGNVIRLTEMLEMEKRKAAEIPDAERQRRQQQHLHRDASTVMSPERSTGVDQKLAALESKILNIAAEESKLKEAVVSIATSHADLQRFKSETEPMIEELKIRSSTSVRPPEEVGKPPVHPSTRSPLMSGPISALSDRSRQWSRREVDILQDSAMTEILEAKEYEKLVGNKASFDLLNVIVSLTTTNQNLSRKLEEAQQIRSSPTSPASYAPSRYSVDNFVHLDIPGKTGAGNLQHNPSSPKVYTSGVPANRATWAGNNRDVSPARSMMSRKSVRTTTNGNDTDAQSATSQRTSNTVTRSRQGSSASAIGLGLGIDAGAHGQKSASSARRSTAGAASVNIAPSPSMQRPRSAGQSHRLGTAAAAPPSNGAAAHRGGHGQHSVHHGGNAAHHDARARHGSYPLHNGPHRHPSTDHGSDIDDLNPESHSEISEAFGVPDGGVTFRRSSTAPTAASPRVSGDVRGVVAEGDSSLLPSSADLRRRSKGGKGSASVPASPGNSGAEGLRAYFTEDDMSRFTEGTRRILFGQDRAGAATGNVGMLGQGRKVGGVEESGVGRVGGSSSKARPLSSDSRKGSLRDVIRNHVKERDFNGI